MTQDNLVKFQTPETSENFSDALSDLIRKGAQQIIAQAIEAELNELLREHQARDDSGRQAAVRNGYLPARTITTGVGEVEVQVSKVRDRSGNGIKFNSTLLPPYLKRSRSVEEGGCAKNPKEELDAIGATSPTLIALGVASYAILTRNLSDRFSIVKAPHYAMYISKENYRREFENLCSS